eukprot:scaffold24468_cov47-Attheya_sp.AAC.1
MPQHGGQMMGVPSLGGNTPGMMMAAANPVQEKVNRELFVGNTPPGTSEMLLMQFLNGALKRVGLCEPNVTPIVNCRVNEKFAFIELISADYANKALNVSGIPFMGAHLKVSRPSKYMGPHIPSKTWQELTGQPMPSGIPGIESSMGGGGYSDPNEKVMRELFIGNTTPEMSEQMIKDFLGKAMEQVGLTKFPGNPINACRVSGKFAFIELRDKEEAASALNLNNIPFMGAMLRVGRPSKYVGPQVPHGNWEDILAKYMSGELKLGGAPAAAPAAPATGPPTKVVELKHMLTMQDLTNDEEYGEILEDTKEECSQFGALKNIIIPRSGVGATKIFLEYMTNDDAQKAITGLAGRTFDGRKVEAVFFNEDRFNAQDYS